MRLNLYLLLFLLLTCFLAACAAPPAAPKDAIAAPGNEQPVLSSPTAQPVEETPGSETSTEAATQTDNPEPAQGQPTDIEPPSAESVPTTLPEPTAISTTTPRPSPAPDEWQSMPVVPQISEHALQIYRRGLELGNDPRRFSKVGDCQNVSSYFLSPFDFASAYRLGEYGALQETIDWYKGSFSRDSLAVKGGFNVAAVLSPLRADSKQCDDGESPVECELRLHNPSVVIVSMETWWSGNPGNYEKYMRQLLDYLISEGVVPILATKADNLEGGHQINKTLAQLAWEYDIPLWNFWASLQDLPNHGLTEDGFHLTLGNYFYDDSVSTSTGWSRRNLTALQALDAFRRAIVTIP